MDGGYGPWTGSDLSRRNRGTLRVRWEYPVYHPRISRGVCGFGKAGQGDGGTVADEESSGVLGGGVNREDFMDQTDHT